MAGLQLSGVNKAFGDTAVLQDVDLSIQDGEFVVFVGPSGCGKSTLLRVIAGLEEVSSGEIRIRGRRVNDLSPAQRGIAMVFQSYALYPQMTVYQNMAFSLKLGKADPQAADKAVRAAAAILNIEHLLDRKPRALSGGQRQRVAIGRAIVREPEVFLFDEPLSNLDAALRVRMRYEFASLHKRLGTTMIYVTHDQVEAMTLADRIVALSAGRIEQVGTPMELYRRPKNLFVAGFIGSPRMNLLPAVLVAGGPGNAEVRLGSGTIVRTQADVGALGLGASVTLGLRPEHLRSDGAAEEAMPVEVRFVEALGHTAYGYGVLAGTDQEITCELPGDTQVRAGDVLNLRAPHALAHLFDAEGRAFERHS